MDKQPETGFKTCNQCKQSKPFECFSKTPKGKGCRFNLRSKCKECHSQNGINWHHNNKERAKNNRKKWYKSNKEYSIQYAIDWRENNPERAKETMRKWTKKNAPRRAMKQTERKASQFNATPSWLSAIELAQIQEMYDVAAAKTMQTGIKHHVDHIHPLQGNAFNGLHVPWNLQILTAFENISKKNRIPKGEEYLFWEHE